MSIYKFRSGLGDSSAYQVSGKPFATGSLVAPASSGTPVKVEFPTVTSWIKVIPTTGSSATHLRIGFSEKGVKDGSNYFRYLAGNNFNHESASPAALDLKVTELYFLGDDTATVEFDVVAGLTDVLTSEITNNWTGSAGVG